MGEKLVKRRGCREEGVGVLDGTPAGGDFVRGKRGGDLELGRGDRGGVVKGCAFVRGGGEVGGETQVVHDVG